MRLKELLHWHPRRLLNAVTKTMCIVLAGMMLVSALIYGYTVYVEGKLLSLSRETRNLAEENQELQIAYDRTRSFKKVAQVSGKVQGLDAPTQVLDVVARPKATFTQTHPATPVPRGLYGY